jgi:DNA-directed RNA polymerase subunit beta
VVSEGGDVEVADDDDDLLKAAEELGMDLTGVRADGNGSGAADEREEQVVAEGEGGTDGAKSEDAEEAKVED